MTKHTFTTLVQLNNEFYKTVAKDFSDSRNASWSGWDHLIPVLKKHVSKSGHIKVLDVGCGNGRFATFLLSHLDSTQFTYYGVDNSASLLNSAQHRFSTYSNTSFIKSDFISQDLAVSLPPDWTATGFDFIVCFGVFHHIPSQAARQKFLSKLESLLAPQGVCVISCWQFTNSTNLMRRQVSPEEINILTSDLEPGDYILDWQRGKQAYRYCHLTTQIEMTTLIAETNLVETDFWIADGKTENLNHYYLFEEKEQ